MDPYLGQIALFPFGFTPKNWAACNGQMLPINQNQPLFSLLGTTYGGNGSTNFALPNLQSQVIVGMGSNYALGQKGGEFSHVLTVAELPSHIHPMQGSGAMATLGTPANSYPAASPEQLYTTGSPTTTLGSSSSSTGSGQPHPNMPPYLVLQYCICMSGIFPSRN